MQDAPDALRTLHPPCGLTPTRPRSTLLWANRKAGSPTGKACGVRDHARARELLRLMMFDPPSGHLARATAPAPLLAHWAVDLQLAEEELLRWPHYCWRCPIPLLMCL